jgi:beta-lactamase class A
MLQIETASGGRLGVSLLDMKAAELTQHRGDERFPMCSTFKVLAAAAVLKKADPKLAGLNRRVSISTADIVENSPVTSEHVGTEGLSLRQLCDAALTRSDNTAGNLLLNEIGGTSGLTNFARTLGDKVTRLDRTEPTLNEATPGDPRDTSTPNAMMSNLKKLLLGDVLIPPARAQLTEWMIANKTGDTRLRAGLPVGWRVGDKTGAGDHGTTNDIAVIWPPGRPPLIVAVFLTGATVDASGRNQAIAGVGREMAKRFA